MSRALAVAAVLASVLASGCEGGGPAPSPRPAPRPSAAEDAGADRGRGAPEGAAPAAPAVASGAPGAIVCRVPDVTIPASPECGRGKRYPDCRQQLPDPAEAGGLYGVWRNTVPEHRWGRLALVTLVLATAREYAARHPGEPLTVGDLDAPGPRHRTHRHGVDVDLYLPGRMATENRGDRDYPSNYDGQPGAAVEESRRRVLDLAEILATCSRGQLRIYYNDEPVIERFGAWFDAAGLTTPLGRPMEAHNLLHLFHFHVTVTRGLEPLPVPGGPAPPGGTDVDSGDPRDGGTSRHLEGSRQGR